MSSLAPLADLGGGDNRNLQSVLRIMRGAGVANASDLHLKVGGVPRARVEGNLCSLDHPPLDVQTVDTAVMTLASLAGVPAERLALKQFDFSVDVKEIGRFRVHVYTQRGTRSLALRRIPSPIPDFAALRLPRIAKRIAVTDRGLILVTGATGNGKSTTIASILDFLNQNASKHVVTLEDPVEFVFDDRMCSFSQREVGRDVDTIEEGLTGVLREDPDVLFIGEIRSLAEFDVALNAAESGRVVLSSFHAASVGQAVQRMINLYPMEHREPARARIADSLAAVISQKLVPKKNARENVLVTEVLTRAPTVLDCIREPSRMRGLTAALESGTREYGSHSFDQVVRSMVQSDLITMDTAKAVAHSANDLLRNMKLMR
ncbi:MAG: PilT/PilU family type 4a pilus ATPase [Myxococcales bacterium]|nr:PilT/PilU family type 4a pilus ATPase [Myxococcales bacterium]